MTKQQYFIAALCILFMAGLQFAGFKMKEKTGKNNPLWYDDDEEDDKGKGRAKAKTAEKVPDEVEDSELDFEQQKRLAAAWTETKIREEVRIAILEKPQWGGRRFHILKSLGWRINAPVLEIINDPAMKSKLLTEAKGDYEGVIPLRVACNLMRDHATELIAEPIYPWMQHNDPKVRGIVGQMIATSGSAKYATGVKSALNDKDDDVVRLTFAGLAQAKKIAPEYEAVLFDNVKRHAEGGEHYQAAEVLLALNEKRALEFIESDAFFRLESKGLTSALRAVIDRKNSIARPKLLKLIEEARAAQSKASDQNARANSTLAVALHLLGRQQNPADSALFELLMNSKHAGYVATGYLAYHGLDEITELLDKARENNEWEGLNRQKKLYMALQELDWAMDEGGLAEYLESESGDHFQEALDGLKAIDMPDFESSLKTELTKISKTGVSNNTVIRQKQVEMLLKKNPKTFDKFDAFYHDMPESIYAQLAKFAVKNKESFK